MIDHDSIVSVRKCDTYDRETVLSLLRQQLLEIGITSNTFKDKKVAIKPNLVRRCDEAKGATTHSAFSYAVATIALEMGAKQVIFAESPGGIFTSSTIKSAYSVAHLDKVAKETGAILNFDTDAVTVEAPSGVQSKVFHILKSINDADVIINLAKLKTHGLTLMSAAVKNYFGVIPGVEKFEMHARFPDKDDFSNMIVDLCYMLCQSKTTINIVDGIVGMEGNGPTNGTPKKMGVVIASQNPFAADVVCSKILGVYPHVKTVVISQERGYAPKDEIITAGESVDACIVKNLVLPDGLDKIHLLSDEKLLKIFKPKPVVNRSVCKKCGECARSCPMHTISVGKDRKIKINTKNCIRCFCCQELCPFDAIKIKQNPIFFFIK